MKLVIGVVASVAMVSLSAGAFAQATGTGNTGATDGTGKNNTVEEQTGKATSSSPGSIGKTGTVPPAAPDNRNPSPMGTSDPSGPMVK